MTRSEQSLAKYARRTDVYAIVVTLSLLAADGSVGLLGSFARAEEHVAAGEDDPEPPKPNTRKLTDQDNLLLTRAGEQLSDLDWDDLKHTLQKSGSLTAEERRRLFEMLWRIEDGEREKERSK